MTAEQDTDIESLRSTWKIIYSETLPSLARSKDAAQPKWPVTLDHCFARIILDNTVGSNSGKDDDQGMASTITGALHEDDSNTLLVPWDTVISRPAVRSMTITQLQAAIDLGERIQAGTVDLVELDRRSLSGRGKSEGKYGSASAAKRKREEQKTDSKQSKRGKIANDTTADHATGTKKVSKKQATLPFSKTVARSQNLQSEDGLQVEQLEHELGVKSSLSREKMVSTLKRIRDEKSLTPFRRRLYTSLLSVPRGEYTTYAALASHLDSVARAVGNGMRNNPFAPDVPCHRVLASDRSIGGFGGDWSRDGKRTGKQDKKLDLLRQEGVKFDSTDKVKGPVWNGFWDWDDFVREYGEIE